MLSNRSKCQVTDRGEQKKKEQKLSFLLSNIWYTQRKRQGIKPSPEKIPSSARNNLSGISRSRTSPNTKNIFQWYSTVLPFSFYLYV